MHRAIIINMQRPARDVLKRFDENDRAFIVAREEIQKWAATCSLAQDPEMPIYKVPRTHRFLKLRPSTTRSEDALP
jgi:hypothetical protein